MSYDITPQKAKTETDENLTILANQYRSDSGAYQIVMNEIKRRNDMQKIKRRIYVAIIIGFIGLLFWWIRNFI